MSSLTYGAFTPSAMVLRAGLIVAGLIGGFASMKEPVAAAEPLHLVALGDSLTAGYLLPQDKALPAVLERRLREKGYSLVIANAGVSGDTTADGLARLEWSIPENTSGVIVALGANDMLRGLDPAMARANLTAILERLQARKIAVFLIGMRAPANYGAAYVEAFDRIYPDLAKAFDVPLYPFMLDGVTGKSDLSLTDGLHPNGEGVEEIARRIGPALENFIGTLH